MVSSPYFLAVDQGTQSTKAVLFNHKGDEIQSCSVPVTLLYSAEGQISQDPEEIFFSVLESIRTVIHESGISPAKVAALAIDSQICSLVAVDERLRPVTEIISHLDPSSNRIRDQLLAIQGERIISQNGSMPYIASRLLWLKKTQPKKYKDTYRVMLVGAYCSAKLCGLTGEDAYVDRTTMNVFGWGDLEKRDWDNELAEDIGINMDLSPLIRDPREIIGGVDENIAASCGLKAGTPVLAGTGDAIAGWIGLGADQPGMMVDTSGTANHLSFCARSFKPDLSDRILSFYPSVSESLGFQIGFTAGTGKSHRWAADLLQGKTHFLENSTVADKGFQTLDAAANEIPPGSDGVVFIPHFAGRVCPPMPGLKGGWLGLDWNHSRAHLYRSVLESIAYEYVLYLNKAKELYPEEEFNEFYTVGGGSKSKVWAQIKADVLGFPVKILTGAENLAARGSALLAAEAIGEDANFLASRHRQEAVEISPDANNVACYSQYQTAYMETITCLAEAGLETNNDTQ